MVHNLRKHCNSIVKYAFDNMVVRTLRVEEGECDRLKVLRKINYTLRQKRFGMNGLSVLYRLLKNISDDGADLYIQCKLLTVY